MQVKVVVCPIEAVEKLKIIVGSAISYAENHPEVQSSNPDTAFDVSLGVHSDLLKSLNTHLHKQQLQRSFLRIEKDKPN